MSGLTGRMATFVKTEISALLDQAEDPAETLDYAYERQLEDLQNVKQGIAGVVSAKKRLQLQDAALRRQADKLDGQARQAMSAGRESLAHAALERKHVIAGELDSLAQQVVELELEQQKLIDSEHQLRSMVEAFRSKKELIKAQYSDAEARVRISEAATGVDDATADVGLAVRRVLEKTDDMKARASRLEDLQAAGTFEDLAASGTPHGEIDRQLAALEATSAVEDEFARLKAEVGLPATPSGEAASGDHSHATNTRTTADRVSET
jgi:phage shock protein A